MGGAVGGPVNAPVEGLSSAQPIFEPLDKVRALELLQVLLADPRARVTLEGEGDAWRLEWSVPGDRCGMLPYRKRVFEVVSGDIYTIEAIRARLEAARAWRRGARNSERAIARDNAEADRAADRKRRQLRRKVMAAAYYEGWAQEEMGKLFDMAAALGDEWLADLVAHKPWESGPSGAIHPRRPAGGWGSEYTPPINRPKD